MKTKRKSILGEANKVYFKSLANTRASSAMMINSWTGYFCSHLKSFVLFI